MFSPERFGSQRTSFGVTEAPTGRNFIGLKTAFRPKDSRTPLQKAAHFRFSEPATPSVQSGRGWRPSDLTDPHKREFLTELTGRIFHLAASGVGTPQRTHVLHLHPSPSPSPVYRGPHPGSGGGGAGGGLGRLVLVL
ncbi:hypothetical protein E2C01_088587 [Portunus trituberculatus]|uniref:Uncharacterized protein n=1 Tax=Portunus trituberculatus TaxID=210409 RepID=A0A5B7JF24_PORTR|nr:hypothetical protein [Portunus trituberculatus]